MKIAIGVCEKINGICTTMGCFKALNNREKNFSIYKNENLELMSFFTCDSCSSNSDENLINIARKLEQAGVQKLHLGVCIVKCQIQRTEEIKEIFKRYNIEVVEGTH
ncbi:CGGC domain-containing protein [Clostridium gasigenes]|uniref:CGGC domain-containing protein n=1 Tax=Clostridium gasigenes TaxID=94869 RepID=UPI00143869AE|nr:CGGC domain-containing protein [Clostridium gasigenes]MBU3133126.1 CGGC domain-containing protein [Clostridium gasigenes]NKF08749.1 CGGC domain-containing protein [Clostridium gasigenes]QSW19965.1 CGGC domain-containing protein [Clostridium gasigenes]